MNRVVHISVAKEITPKRGESAVDQVLRQVKEFGGYTVFWATSTKRIAEAAHDLELRGVVVRKEPPSPFPWIACYLSDVKP